MVLDAVVPAGLLDEVQVVGRKTFEVRSSLFVFFARPFVAVVVMPMCENIIAAFVEAFYERGNGVS